jgi:hypothetical protein
MANRTAKGNVTEQARERYGMRGTGKYPVFDRQSALSAIRLRHHGEGVSPASVLDKVARWAREHNDEVVLDAVRRAREVDRNR